MNIFFLDYDPIRCAQYHVDKHVIKLPLETAQLLCTCLHLNNISSPYKPTHVNHGTAKWVRECRENFEWTIDIGLALSQEYTFRYGKTHACHHIIKYCQEHAPALKKNGKPTKPYYAFQTYLDQCFNEDPVLAYRNYYNVAKQHLFNWKNRPTPDWILDNVQKITA